MMIDDDNDGQMIFGDLRGLKLPDVCFTGEEKPRKILTQETCTDRGSNPGPLRDRRACYPLSNSGGQKNKICYGMSAGAVRRLPYEMVDKNNIKDNTL